MFSEAKVTEIYCLADDFCKEFEKVAEELGQETICFVQHDKSHFQTGTT